MCLGEVTPSNIGLCQFGLWRIRRKLGEIRAGGMNGCGFRNQGGGW